MKSYFLLCLLGILFIHTQAQSEYIKLNIPDYHNAEISFCSQFGEKSRIIETLKTNNSGYAEYDISELETGVYRLYLDTEIYFDVIVNHENIKLSLLANAPLESMEVLESNENQILYSFLKQNSVINQKLDVLEYFLSKYSKGKLYNSVSKEYKEVIKEQVYLADEVTAAGKSSFAASMIQYYKTPVIPKEVLKYGDENQYLKENYFSYYPFDNPLLINSPVYSIAVLNYLKLHTVQGNYNASVQGFKTASERILKHTEANTVIFNHVLKILIDGFESLQLFEIADYLLANYGSKCVDDDNLSLRYKNISELPVGSLAPLIDSPDINGIEVKSYQGNYTIVVFWATWCDHCRQVIPMLNEYFLGNMMSDLNIVLVSLDTEHTDLQNFIEQNKVTFPVVCDYKSWGGKLANDFAVFATPFYYAIDKEGKIMAKPHDFDELIGIIKELK